MTIRNSSPPGTCLVTGAAGFIGSHLSERLLAQGHSVLGIDCFTDYYDPAVKRQNVDILRRHPQFALLTADLLDVELKDLLRERRIDYVFHLAAQAGVRASWGRSFEIYTRNNILATQALLEACKGMGLKKFVYASSSSVYGDAETYPTAESIAPHPISPYGVSKLAGEHLCLLYWRNYGVPANALRYFTVYGPRQRPDMAFNKFIRCLVAGKEFEIYGDGEQTRDFTYVDDAVQGTIAAGVCQVSGEVFNLGGGSRVTVNEVIRSLESILAVRARIKYIEVQKGDVRHTAADTSKAQHLLEYRPSVTLEQGLSREAQWLQASPAAPLAEAGSSR